MGTGGLIICFRSQWRQIHPSRSQVPHLYIAFASCNLCRVWTLGLGSFNTNEKFKHHSQIKIPTKPHAPYHTCIMFTATQGQCHCMLKSHTLGHLQPRRLMSIVLFSLEVGAVTAPPSKTPCIFFHPWHRKNLALIWEYGNVLH